MTGRERVKRALEFQSPDRAPRELWALPGIFMFKHQEYQEVLEKYPSDFVGPVFRYGQAERARGTPGEVGTYVDEWGCIFTVAEPGVIGEVKEPILNDLSKVNSLKPPVEILKEADFSKVNESCHATDKYVKTGTTVRPFERMQFLRGTENLFMDVAYGVKEFETLRNIVHDFFIQEMEMWAKTDVDGVSFMDDWGTQTSLLISPDMWRSIFKPMYADYCNILHSAGKHVFFHSDGNISAIYPDLIEIGVDALNSQLFTMDIEELGLKYKGKITFWGEIDRQNVLPFGTVEDVKNAVRRVRKALDDGTGGVIAQCEWGNDVRRENIEAVFEAWLEPL